MAKIHHSSIIDIRAELDEDVEVGPFCMVGPHVRIGAGTVLESHVVVKGLTTIGRNNRFFQGAAIGCEPQDKKYKGEETYLEIGDDNIVREGKTYTFGEGRNAKRVYGLLHNKLVVLLQSSGSSGFHTGGSRESLNHADKAVIAVFTELGVHKFEKASMEGVCEETDETLERNWIQCERRLAEIADRIKVRWRDQHRV
jgi:hypothetical protein